MISFSEATLSHISIHKIGNRQLDENLLLSKAPLEIEDDILTDLLLQYFSKPFEKVNEVFRFTHVSGDLNLNEVYHFAEMAFEDNDRFQEASEQIAKHLFDAADHPKIKSGELYVCLFSNAQIEGELFDAIGIFKSESKEPYLKVYHKDRNFEMEYEEQGINIKKLDKGCIIFKTEKEEGYKAAVIDQTNQSDTVYWVDQFLKLKIRNDNYNQTQNTLSIYKDFVTNKMGEEFDMSKTDKIDLLNRSIKYFKEKDSFDLEEFSYEVIANEQGIEMFKNYKKEYEAEFDSPIADSFSISDAAVKKQARVFKSVLKLDKNFHIYIHGNNELIEKGFDEQKKMNYYKVYFREEN